MPVMKATSTHTSKNNIQWWKILPSSDKEITHLKSSWSLGYNLRKRIVLQRRIVLVLLTAVDLRQTIMYAAWPDNISLQSTSLPPKGFQRVLLVSITIFISSYLHFFFQIQVVRRSLSLSIKMIYNQVLRDKRKSPHCFDQRISRAFPGNLHKTFKTIFGCPNWKKEWIKISSTKHNKKIDIYIFGFVSLRPKLRNTIACIQTPPLPPPPLSESTDLLLLNIPCLFPV